LPFLETALATTSLAVLKGASATSFLVNTISVSVPGRIDEAQDQAMRQGALNPSKPTGEAAAAAAAAATTDETPLVGTLYSAARTRSIVSPAGWAFAIWVRKEPFVGAILFCHALTVYCIPCIRVQSILVKLPLLEPRSFPTVPRGQRLHPR
jgi:hypothetical protein